MNEKTLTQLKHGDTAVIMLLQGGRGFQQRLRRVGLREGKSIRMVAKHPFSGPVVIELERRHITIGQGMAHRIVVEQHK